MNVFDQTDFDRASELTAYLKAGIADAKARIEYQTSALQDVKASLIEAQDTLFQARQEDLFKDA